jgi:putative membrane protein
MISAVLSSLHVLALAIGLPAVFLRGRALKGPLDADGVRRLLAADNVWGVAAVLWIVTGLLRAFAGLETSISARRSSGPRWSSSS